MVNVTNSISSFTSTPRFAPNILATVIFVYGEAPGKACQAQLMVELLQNVPSRGKDGPSKYANQLLWSTQTIGGECTEKWQWIDRFQLSKCQKKAPDWS